MLPCSLSIVHSTVSVEVASTPALHWTLTLLQSSLLEEQQMVLAKQTGTRCGFTVSLTVLLAELVYFYLLPFICTCGQFNKETTSAVFLRLQSAYVNVRLITD